MILCSPPPASVSLPSSAGGFITVSLILRRYFYLQIRTDVAESSVRIQFSLLYYLPVTARVVTAMRPSVKATTISYVSVPRSLAAVRIGSSLSIVIVAVVLPEAVA